LKFDNFISFDTFQRDESLFFLFSALTAGLVKTYLESIFRQLKLFKTKPVAPSVNYPQFDGNFSHRKRLFICVEFSEVALSFAQQSEKKKTLLKEFI
jgi:hypothetical protein